MSDGRRYCTFSLAGLLFGVDVSHVQEILRFQEMTRVPLAPPTVRGLINLRGRIVTALDLRERLGLPPRDAGSRPLDVVVRAGDAPVALLVDEIGDVVQVDEESCEPPPATLQGVARDLLLGVHALEDRLLLVLDTARAVRCDAAAATAVDRSRGDGGRCGCGR